MRVKNEMRIKLTTFKKLRRKKKLSKEIREVNYLTTMRKWEEKKDVLKVVGLVWLAGQPNITQTFMSLGRPIFHELNKIYPYPYFFSLGLGKLMGLDPILLGLEIIR